MINKNYQAPVNMVEAEKRWGKIVEKLGITDLDKKSKMVEYAQIHADSLQSGMIKENVGYSNAANTMGMGAVMNPGFSGTPGLPGTAGSGDLAQTLLPGALKIWAQTPGLDLVNTINVNSNVVRLLYFDFKYDDVKSLDLNDERSTTVKVAPALAADLTALKAWLRAEMAFYNVTEERGKISKQMFFNLALPAVAATATAPAAAAFAGVATGYSAIVRPSGSLQGWVEFVGFGRIDDLPMFRVYIQPNTATSGQFGFNQALNTLPVVGTMPALFNGASIIDTSSTQGGLATVSTTTTACSLASLAEEFVTGFTTARQKGAMTRDKWDATYADKIGPDSFTKDIEIGVAHVKASLRLSEMDDYKKMYGINIVERTKAQCINLMSQQISVEIVDKIKELAERNRATTSASGVPYSLANWGPITDPRIHDLSVPAVAAALGGEHNASIARKLSQKAMEARYYIANDGRVGDAQFILTSARGAAALKNNAGYTINPAEIKMVGPGNLQPAGTLDGLKIYVDPFMNPSDLTLFMGRIPKNEEPGLHFLAYILAQTVDIVSEATFGQTMYMYSRYAVAELGFYPEKQYLSVKCFDPIGII